ncbi:MAG: hypothetical protein ACK42E_01715, partial [Candidatus Bipolaricaulaceae bacterium]
QQRLTLGRSLFAFDALPTQSQIGVTVGTRSGSWAQKLSLGWDLLGQAPLPASWSLSGPNLSLQFSVRLLPAPGVQGQAQWRWRGPSWVVEASAGYAEAWQDVLVRGSFSWESLDLAWGARLSPWPLALRRLYVNAAGAISAEWAWSAVLEYDLARRSLVQAEAGVFRTFAGCLRAGLRLGLGTLRLSLDIPAFPEFSVTFAPLDEGLRVGGL